VRLVESGFNQGADDLNDSVVTVVQDGDGEEVQDVGSWGPKLFLISCRACVQRGEEAGKEQLDAPETLPCAIDTKTET
jgi:hypothetical protein